MGFVKAAFKAMLPRWVPNEAYKARTLGLRKYVRYTWLIRTQARKMAMPQPNVPYDIDAPTAVALDLTTLHAVRSHFIESAQGIRELRAFKRLAPGHSTFLDIGAAEGIFSAAFCALTGGSAYAFEPSPDMFERLTALAAANADFNMHLSSIALGATEKTQAVDVYSDSQYRGVDGDAEAIAVMAVNTLDDFVGQHGIDVRFREDRRRGHGARGAKGRLRSVPAMDRCGDA